MEASMRSLVLLAGLLMAAGPSPAATVTVLDAAGDVGSSPALAIGPDGRGLVAYYDATNGDLKVAHCEDLACTSAAVSTLDAVGDVGRFAAIAMGADGRGVVSYFDATRQALKVAHCSDTACSAATVTVVDPSRVRGQTSVAIGADGLALVSYVRREGASIQLAVAHCSDAACTAATVSGLPGLVGEGGLDWYDTSLAIGADGRGLVAFVPIASTPGPGAVPKVAHCADLPCTSVTTAAPNAERGAAALVGMDSVRRPSLSIDAAGRGLVSYRRAYTGIPSPWNDVDEFRLRRCADAACTTFSSDVALPAAPLEGVNAPLVAGAGVPWFVRERSGRIRLSQCDDPECATRTETCALAPAADLALARGTDGVALAAFYTRESRDLAVVHGFDPCVPAAVSAHDTALTEGPSPHPWVMVTVDLPPDASGTVDYATVDGTARAGTDYVAVTGTLTFAPGSVLPNVVFLTLLADGIDEPDEQFTLVLSNPQGGVVLGDATAVVTIVDADPMPQITLGDCEMFEGDTGTAECVFTTDMFPGSSEPVTVAYATADGTATAGSDYLATAGTFTFPPGANGVQFRVPIVGDEAVELDETFELVLSNPTHATIGDGVGAGVIRDDDAPSLSSIELTHGARLQADLAAQAGPVADADHYRLEQEPWASYEVVADAVSGDLGPGLLVERLAEDNATVRQTSVPVGTGGAVALRWRSPLAFPDHRETIRVRSASCTTDCGPDDGYRLRFHETTASIARFNNVGGQVTVLVLQNTTGDDLAAVVHFWHPSGGRYRSAAVALAARATVLVPTQALLPGQSGSVTIAHDGPYGALAGKGVAVEPATGASFDSPLTYKPR
jgi:hypothetical protein